MVKLLFLGILILNLLLSGCAKHPKPFKSPNGKTAYVTECVHMEDCMISASNLCKSNYNIINQSTGTVGIPSQYGTLISHKNYVTVECDSNTTSIK